MMTIKFQTTNFKEYFDFCFDLYQSGYKLEFTKTFSILKFKTLYKVKTVK